MTSPTLFEQLREKSETSKDERTWSEIFKQYPYVRELLSETRKLFLQSAEGASEGRPWHRSLLTLTERAWTQKESEAIVGLVLSFLNDDFDS